MGRQEMVKVLLVLGLSYLCLVLGKGLWQLYQARGRIDEAQMALTEARDENERLKEEFGRVNTDEFKEKEVRNKLNRQLPGETVVIVPEIAETKGQEEEKTREMTNWEKWLAVFN